MSYTKQNWADKTVVTKSGLINMDNQIAANEEAATSQGTRLTAVEALASSASSTATAANTTATALANGTTAAGNANKLGNQLPSYFASASSLSLNGYGEQSGGRNLIDYQRIWCTKSSYTFDNADGIISATADTFTEVRIHPTYDMIGKQLTFSAKVKKDAGISNVQIVYYKNDSAFKTDRLECDNWMIGKVTVTPESTSDFWIISYGSGATNKIYLEYAQLEYGNVATDYEPYFASNKSLTDIIDRDFELERFGYACPIINGIRNFVDSDGVLHRRIARVDLGSLAWSYNRDGYHVFRLTIPSVKSSTSNAQCSAYVYGATIQQGEFRINGNEMELVDSNYTSASAMESHLKGIYLYYELATEETYSAYDTPSVQSMISDEWQSGTTYSVGSYCIDENVLYKCLVQNSGQNPKTSATYWEVTNISKEFGRMLFINKSVNIASAVSSNSVVLSDISTKYISGYFAVRALNVNTGYTADFYIHNTSVYAGETITNYGEYHISCIIFY